MRIKGLMGVASLVSAAVLALTSCSGGGSATESGSTSLSGEVIKLEYLHRLSDGQGMTPVAEIIKKWNDTHPNVQVIATRFSGKATEMAAKLEADVKAGTAPCLAQVAYGEAPGMFVKNLLEDVSAEAAKYKDDYTSSAYAQMSVGGKMVGLPQDTGPLVYLYNEAEFNALGIEVPKTFDELLEAAKKAAAQGKYILGFEPDEAGCGRRSRLVFGRRQQVEGQYHRRGEPGGGDILAGGTGRQGCAHPQPLV